MDRLEREDHEATRRHLKAPLGIEGDSGNTNAELAAKVRGDIERRRRRLRELAEVALTSWDSDGRRYRRRLILEILEELR